MRRILLGFLLVVALGVVAATAAYRHFQTSLDEVDAAKNRARIELTDTDKKLIEARDSTSKWLLGLAFALLPGLVIKRSADGDATPQRKLLPLFAAASIIVSMYGFFLSQDAVVFVLSRGPQYHLYGRLSEFPIIVQFWSLISAVIALMLHWFRSAPNIQFPTVGLALAVFLSTGDASSAPLPTAELRTCVSGWALSRGVTFTAPQLSSVERVLKKLAVRSKIHSTARCDYYSSQLDHLRWMAYQESSSDSVESINGFVAATDLALSKAGLSPGDAVDKLLALSAIWRGASGLIKIETKAPGALVLLNRRPVGLTTFEVRVAEGTYVIEVLRAGAAVYVNQDVKIVDGQLWQVSVEK